MGVVLCGGLAAQAAADWAQAFPDDDLPQLLLRTALPSGRLATFAALAQRGERAHAALLGMLRLQSPPVHPDLADAFGALDARAAWMVPVLGGMLEQGESPAVVLELLRRLGPVAKAALPTVRQFAGKAQRDRVLQRRVDAALAAIAGGAAPAPPALPPVVDLPPPATLLARLQEGGGLAWPALQAVLSRGDADELYAALRTLTLQAAGGAEVAERLRCVLTWSCAGKAAALPMDPGEAPAAERLVVLRQAALTALPVQRARQFSTLLQDADASVQEALLVWVAQWPQAGGLETSLRRMVTDSLRRRGNLPEELMPLLRARLGEAERQQLVADLRLALAGKQGPQDMVQTARLQHLELDVVTPDLVPLLLLALRGSLLEQFAVRSLCNAGADCVPALLAALDGGDMRTRQYLQTVLGRMRPTPPAAVQAMIEAVSARDPRMTNSTTVLREMQRDVVVGELLQHLAAADCPSPLRWLARDLHDPRLDAVLAAAAARSTEVDPQGLDASARWELFRTLAQRGKPGFLRMVELLHHPDHDVRIAALRAFGSAMFDAPGQVEVLLQLLDDPDREIVHHAAAGLGAVTTEKQEVAAILCERWDAAEESLRQNFVTAFAGLRASAAVAVPLLAARLQGEADVRRGAAYALLRIQPEHAGAAACMLALLGDADIEVRCQTMHWLRADPQLQRRFAEVIVPQIASDDPRVQQQVLYALKALEPEWAQKVAARVRALRLSTDMRVNMWAQIVGTEKLGEK